MESNIEVSLAMATVLYCWALWTAILRSVVVVFMPDLSVNTLCI